MILTGYVGWPTIYIYKSRFSNIFNRNYLFGKVRQTVVCIFDLQFQGISIWTSSRRNIGNAYCCRYRSCRCCYRVGCCYSKRAVVCPSVSVVGCCSGCYRSSNRSGSNFGTQGCHIGYCHYWIRLLNDSCAGSCRTGVGIGNCYIVGSAF